VGKGAGPSSIGVDASQPGKDLLRGAGAVAFTQRG
jgi:hypothetical protein